MALQNVLTTDKIVEEYGKYYEKAGQNRQRLVRALMTPSVTLEKNARRIPTEETIYKAADFTTSSVVQPYSHDFTPMGNLEFIPNPVYLRQVKTDIQIVPNEIEESWLGFLAANNCTIKDWPIVRFIMEEFLKNQIEQDRELKMVYNGVYNPSAEERKPENCLDGIHKLLVDGASAKYPINVIKGIGELSADTVFDQVESFNAKIPSRYFNEKLTLFMAPEMALEYLRNKREKGYYQIKGDEEIGYRIDFTNHTIFGSPAMAGTKHLWASVQRNLLWLTKRYQPISNIQIQVFDRVVKLLLDWWEGLGFACNQMVWASEPTIGQSTTDTASPADGIVVRSLNTILTGAVTTDTGVEVAGRVLGDMPAGATVQFAYGKTSSLGSAAAATLGEDGDYHAEITGLDRNTDYFLQLQVVDGTDTYNSATAVVKTKTTAPSLTMLAMSEIATTSAKATLTYSDPSELVKAGGVEYATDITDTPTAITGTPSAGSMAVNLTSLTLNTSYYVRAYITVDGTKQYTPWTSFTTAAE
ncbi:MAG: hypothetical protein K6G79_04145 [Bacteroidales bacterium]|nr:hypothetical protein [Bacteroidales bacterium]